MTNYQKTLEEERKYLKETIILIKKELELEIDTIQGKKKNLVSFRKDMWENTTHNANDFTRLTEINHYLSELNKQTRIYSHISERIEKYKQMVDSPYFGRIDFKEDGYDTKEKIYIGLSNIIDQKTGEIKVYDWRAPISSLFYRYDLGRVQFETPGGTISGNVSLKRQFKIQNSQLKYFLDSSTLIKDELLQEVLGHNSSPEMRNIVETIQQEQDLIIRDTKNDLLIVQGVAGSGKTSIALHRIAFLLYEGLDERLNSNDVMIISPNDIFSNYISSVLPGLGEENVKEITFNEIISTLFKGRFQLESREEQLETLILSRNTDGKSLRKQSVNFKGSNTFVKILDRLIRYYAHHEINFEDIYFDNKILITKQELKNRFLNNKTGIPIAKQLKRIEGMILSKMNPLFKKKLQQIKKIVAKNKDHQLEVKSFSRLLSIKIATRFKKRLRKFTEIDYWELYKILFDDQKLFLKLSRGLNIPEDIDEIISLTRKNLKQGKLCYEDCTPLLYLMLKIEGSNIFSQIKHVVIDEAQDYYPLQYEVFNLLFNQKAKYTILGDINQSIEKEASNSLYNDIIRILKKNKNAILHLNKSYRSSYEISTFAQNILGLQQSVVPFARHLNEPEIKYKKTPELMVKGIINDIKKIRSMGYQSIAIICKTGKEAESLHSRLNKLIDIKLIKPGNDTIQKGVSVMSTYIAKGLEFDAVIIYKVNKENYYSDFDKKLLYVACTRALHQLIIYYTDEKSPLLKTPI